MAVTRARHGSERSSSTSSSPDDDDDDDMRALLITAALASAILSAAHGAPLSLPHAAHPDRVREAFLGFVNKHGKEYVNDETEMKYRMGVFAENLAAIEESNAVNTFYSEVNEFADETWEEFSTRLWTRHSHHHHHHQEQPHCNPKPDGQSPSPAGRHHHHHHHHHRRRYPESRDWRDLGVVSPVKNQGRCGSCWTFSATGALEAAYALEFGSILSLSEQQILDCAVAFDNWGCSGGWPQHAMAYVKFNGGIDLEASPRVRYIDYHVRLTLFSPAGLLPLLGPQRHLLRVQARGGRRLRGKGREHHRG